MRATVKFILRNDYTREDGKQRLSLRYIAHKKSTFIGFGVSINPKDWDAKTLSVKKKEPYALHYNKAIADIHQRAMNIILKNFNSPLSPIEFRNALFDKTSVQTSFYEFVESELEVLKVDRAKGTIANYNKLINTMKVWKPTLDFKEITLDFIEQFHKHELDEGNLESTVNKKHANFKFLIGRAVLKEKIAKSPYDLFAIKKKITPQNNDVLTEQEIINLHNIYDSDKYDKGKQEVLRTFLFSCYASLSFSEFSIVTYADLKEYIVDGKACLLLCNKRKKNNITYKIPIVSDRVKQLLREGEPFQKIFNPLGNQPTNRYLKEIIEEANINKNMSFHRARHSFRTIAAQKGVQSNIAERIMGHAESNDIKDIYTHLSNEDIIRELIDKWVS